jgi:hypothetical protein
VWLRLPCCFRMVDIVGKRGILVTAKLSRQVQWGNATADSRKGSALMFFLEGLPEHRKHDPCAPGGCEQVHHRVIDPSRAALDRRPEQAVEQHPRDPGP